LPDINWDYHMVSPSMSSRFLKHLDDNFSLQVLREASRKGALLELLLENRKGLVGAVAIGCHLDHSEL